LSLNRQMSSEEFGVIMRELARLGRGFTEAVRHIVEQEAEICALQSILERKGLVSAHDLAVAREEASRQVRAAASGQDALELEEHLKSFQGEDGKWKM